MSELLLKGLTITNQCIGDSLDLVQFSPSFYQPSCLALYAELSTKSCKDYKMLLAQLNHFPSWASLPEYRQQCLHHLTTSTTKTEFLLYAKTQLNLGDQDGAIYTLEICNKFKWPDVLRLLARLYLDSNPTKSHFYAKEAASLGDIPSTKVHANILDSGLVTNVQQLSSNRLHQTSLLLSKLDPCFSYNANEFESIGKSGFITTITGNPNHISPSTRSP